MIKSKLTNIFSFLYCCTAISLALLLTRCARQGQLIGGPKDKDAPALDSLRSSPNFIKNFKEKRITFHFDEWLVLKDAATQVLVSPPLAKRPEIGIKGKSVVFALHKDEVLRPNTTYTINFGQAIQDFTEGNIVKDLVYVFSTGEQIDSLSLNGGVVDATNGEAAKDIAVMLYENTSDSVVQQERPYYFARTDAYGQYAFRNLRAGTFKVVAFKENPELKWGGGDNVIGFHDAPVVISDTTKRGINIKVFKNQFSLRLKDKKADSYGFASFTYNGDVPKNLIAIATNDSVTLIQDIRRDTLRVWYHSDVAVSPFQIIAGIDTLQVRGLGGREEFLLQSPVFETAGANASASKTSRAAKKQKTLDANPVAAIMQHPFRPIFLDFGVPLERTDTARWLLETKDTLSTRIGTYDLQPDTASKTRWIMRHSLKPSASYKLTLLPNAIKDIYVRNNKDTLIRLYNVLDDQQFGSLLLEIDGLREGQYYQVQLYAGDALEAEQPLLATALKPTVSFVHLPAGIYTLKIIDDTNGNGKWDTGSYYDHRQPESIFVQKLEALRPNWETKVDIFMAGKKRGK